jgi:outer membrane lipoprotein-sorting protein
MRKAIAALTLGLALAAPVAAQTVDEIITKNNAAKGGVDKLKAVKTVRMTGKITLGPGIEAPIVLEFKRPKGMRMDITVQGMTVSQGYDGTKAWMLNPLQGSKTPQELAGEELKMTEEQADLDGPLVDYKAKGHTVELLGKEKVEGADAFKLKVTMKNGTVRNIFIDAENFLEIKDESKRMIRGTEMETETIAGDYKEVAGIMFPHSMDSGAKGSAQRQKVVIDKIEVNVPVDDARFKMPEVK